MDSVSLMSHQGLTGTVFLEILIVLSLLGLIVCFILYMRQQKRIKDILLHLNRHFEAPSTNRATERPRKEVEDKKPSEPTILGVTKTDHKLFERQVKEVPDSHPEVKEAFEPSTPSSESLPSDDIHTEEMKEDEPPMDDIPENALEDEVTKTYDEHSPSTILLARISRLTSYAEKGHLSRTELLDAKLILKELEGTLLSSSLKEVVFRKKTPEDEIFKLFTGIEQETLEEGEEEDEEEDTEPSNASDESDGQEAPAVDQTNELYKMFQKPVRHHKKKDQLS